MSSSSNDNRSGRRITLPPIRDFFRDEFMRSHPPTQELSSTTLARQTSNEDEREYPPTRPPSSRPNPSPSRMHRSTSEQAIRPVYQSTTYTQERLASSGPIYRELHHTSESPSPFPSLAPVTQHHCPSPRHTPWDAPALHQQPSATRSHSLNRRQNRSLSASSQTSYPDITLSSLAESGTRMATYNNLPQMPPLPMPPNPTSSAQAFRRDSPPALVRAVTPWVIATNLDVGQIYEDDERTPITRPFDTGSVGRSSARFLAPGRSLDEGMHPPLGKYDCKFCGKLFNRPSSLRIHLNSHTGEKPFVCPHPECGRSFSVLSNMRRHARVHMSNPKDQELEESNDETSTQSSPTAPSTPRLPIVGQEPVPMEPSTRSQTHYRRDSNTSASSSSSMLSRSSPSEGGQLEVLRPEKRSRHLPT